MCVRSPAAVHTATLADVDPVAELARARAGGTQTQWAERLTRDVEDAHRGLWIAARSDEIVAYARAGRFERPADASAVMAPSGFYLYGLFVCPSARRQGVGRALTRARLSWIESRARKAWYVTNARNTASQALHAELGFAEVTRAFTYPGVEFDGGAGILCKLDLRSEIA